MPKSLLNIIIKMGGSCRQCLDQLNHQFLNFMSNCLSNIFLRKVMKKKYLIISTIILSVLILSSYDIAKNELKNPKKAKQEKKSEKKSTDEWIVLFNGKNFDGWRGYNRTDMPKAWTIEAELLKLTVLVKVKQVRKMVEISSLIKNSGTLNFLLNGKLQKEVIVVCSILHRNFLISRYGNQLPNIRC